MSVSDKSIPKEPVQNKVVEKIQQFLKDKISSEYSEIIRLDTLSNQVDQNQNTIVNEEERAGVTVLKQVLDYKKSLFFRDPEIVDILKSISNHHK